MASMTSACATYTGQHSDSACSTRSARSVSQCPAIRARSMSGGESPPDDLFALREIQSALGLDLGPQGDIGQGEVVANAFVGRVGDLDRHVR